MFSLFFIRKRKGQEIDQQPAHNNNEKETNFVPSLLAFSLIMSRVVRSLSQWRQFLSHEPVLRLMLQHAREERAAIEFSFTTVGSFSFLVVSICSHLR